MTESEADGAKWRKVQLVRQNDGKCSRCGKMTEKVER